MPTYHFKQYHELLNSKLSQIDSLDRVEFLAPTVFDDHVEARYQYSHLKVVHNPADRFYSVVAFFKADLDHPVSIKGFFGEFTNSYNTPNPSFDMTLASDRQILSYFRSTTEEFVVQHNLIQDVVRVLTAFSTTRYQYMLDVTEPFATIEPNSVNVYLGTMYFKSIQRAERQNRQHLFSLSYRTYNNGSDSAIDLSELPTVCDLDLYVRRNLDRLIRQRVENSITPTLWRNLDFVRYMLTEELVIDIKTQSTDYRTDDSSVALSQLLFVSNAMSQSWAPVLRNKFISLDTIKRHLDNKFYACPIVTTAVDTEIVPVIGALTSNPSWYSTNSMHLIDGLTKPISGIALEQFAKSIRVDECSNCGSFEHKNRQHFALELKHEPYYSMLAELFDGTNSAHRAAVHGLNEPIVFIPQAVSNLFNIALSLYPMDEPSYYCSTCDRGEDEDYHDDDYEYRETALSSDATASLEAIATEYGKTTQSYGNTVIFRTAGDSLDKSNLYQYEVNSYDFGPSLTFLHGNDIARTKLYMGLEWELDHGGEKHAKAIAINSALSGNERYSWTMSDGSLSEGIEIATMPATLDAHTNALNWSMACKVATALGYRGHDTSTAGIHVHINRNFFSDDPKLQMYRASLMALIMERNWDDFAKFSRRRYNRLDQWAKKKDVATRNYEDTDMDLLIDKTKQQYNNGDKYLALNMNRVKTFELRIFRSTTKPDSILATLQFVSNLAHFCKYNGLKRAQTATMQDIIDYHKYPELTTYWNENKNRTVQD